MNRGRCPQCNRECNATNSLRLFLSSMNETPQNGSLQDVMSQIKQTKHECAVHNDLLENFSEKVCDLESQVTHYNRMKNDKTEKLLQLAQLRKDKEIYEKKVKGLERLHMIQKLHAGSAGDVENILNKNLSAKTHATMAVLLKREKANVAEEKKELRTALREIRNHNEELVPKISKLQDAAQIFVVRNHNLRDKVQSAKLKSSATQGE